MPPDPPAATPDVEPMSDAETIPEALGERQRKPSPDVDAVNNDRTVDSWDEDTKAAETSDEECWCLKILLGPSRDLMDRWGRRLSQRNQQRQRGQEYGRRPTYLEELTLWARNGFSG